MHLHSLHIGNRARYITVIGMLTRHLLWCNHEILSFIYHLAVADNITMSSCKKISGAQRRKRKAEQVKEDCKLRKVLESFVKRTVELQDEDTAHHDPEQSSDHEPESDSYNSVQDIDDVQLQVEVDATVSLSKSDCATVECVLEGNPNPALVPVSSKPLVVPVILHKDIGLLEFSPHGRPVIDPDLKEEMLNLGLGYFQNSDAAMPKAAYGAKGIMRGMTRNWFTKEMPNGEQIPRTWLVYSPLKKAAFCFCCLLFPSSPVSARSSFEAVSGFQKWKKMQKMKNHENSQYHRTSFLEWKETERALKGRGVDDCLLQQMNDEKNRWREILKRYLDTIKLLASQNLAFRGHDETPNSMNPGNFIAILQLLSKYDPIIESHLLHVRSNPRSVSYLSHDIQNEFISLLAEEVRNKIISEVHAAKYFGVLFDSTPDVSHTEQLSQVIRYVDINYETNKVEVRETFIDFVVIDKKDAAGYEALILKKLENDGLSFSDCRSQMYDNAAVMSGHINGLQARLMKRNPKAVFVNCDNHSLNLAALHAASVDPTIVTFFGTVEAIYVFFPHPQAVGGKWQTEFH